MSRRLTLGLLVGLVAVVAVVLRVRSQMGRAGVEVISNSAASRPAAAWPEPRDYVVQPWVSLDEVKAGPARIVSLAPSITEIICALGMRDRLAARTRYCHWPPDIEQVPVVGVMAEINYGMIKSLDPDLILSPVNSRDTIDNLKKLGLRCEAAPHETLDDVYTAIEQIGHLCERPKTAAALVASIRGDIEQLEASAAQAKVRPRQVIVVFGELPVPPQAVFVAGPGLFLDRLVELAGHINAARGLLKSSQGEVPLERLRVLDPKMIVEFRERADPATMAGVYQAWSQVGQMQAIRGQKVRSIGGLEWLSAGPRIAIELHRFMTVLSEEE